MNFLVKSAVLAFGCGLSLSCGGDGDDGSEPMDLFIQGNAAQTAPSCEARSESTAALVNRGTLDVGLKLDYEASLLVGSLRNVIPVVEGATVRLSTDTGELVAEFAVPASGALSPEPSDDGGHGIITVTLIPQTLGSEFASELERGDERAMVAEVSVSGTTRGGKKVKSAPLHYVVKVCVGCLVDFPPEALTNTSCNRGGDQTPERTCRPGQDDLVDCRLCAVSNPLCQSAE